jgi:hypothetical protein
MSQIRARSARDPGVQFMRPSTLSILAAALAWAGASSAFADDPAVSFFSSGSYVTSTTTGYTQSSNQAGSAVYFGGDYSIQQVYSGLTTIGSNYVNSNYSAPSAYSKSYAEGDYSGYNHAGVYWEIEGTLGVIPTVATGIPVLLNGEADLEYDGATSGGYYFGYAAATIDLSSSTLGQATQQIFVCGSISTDIQSCGNNAVNDSFSLQPTNTPGLYKGFVRITAYTNVHAYLGSDASQPTDFDLKTATAFIDPTVSIDPAFYAMYPDAKLTFNPIVDNGGNPNGLPIVTPPSAAPEPAAWALMIGGLGLVGAGFRRRRQVVVSQQA